MGYDTCLWEHYPILWHVTSILVCCIFVYKNNFLHLVITAMSSPLSKRCKRGFWFQPLWCYFSHHNAAEAQCNLKRHKWGHISSSNAWIPLWNMNVLNNSACPFQNLKFKIKPNLLWHICNPPDDQGMPWHCFD